MRRICLTANYLVHNHNRSRRGRANAASCILATLFLLFLVATAAAVSFVLFKPKDPKIAVTAVQFPKFSVSNGTFFQLVYVTNPNRNSFTHYNSSLQLVYSGSQVDIVTIPIGEIGGSRTQHIPVEGAKRGRSPPPQSKKISPPPRKPSPVLQSLELHVDQLSKNVNEAHLREIFNGRLGWPEFTPYDAIHVGAAAPDIPPALIEQLKPGGRMVIPVGNLFQYLKVVDKNPDGSISVRDETSVRYVPLTSREAQFRGN